MDWKVRGGVGGDRGAALPDHVEVPARLRLWEGVAEGSDEGGAEGGEGAEAAEGRQGVAGVGYPRHHSPARPFR